MDFLHRPRRLLITGRSGSGKTEFFVRYVEAVKNQYGNVYIFDHETEFHHRTGEPRVETPEGLEKSQGVQCYDYSSMFPGDMQTGLEFYSDYVFQRSLVSQHKSLFCVDEMQKLLSTDTLSPELATIIETGRRYKIDTCFITQQINLLHNRVRNQVTEVITFRQNDARAIDWLESFGFDGERVRSLDSGEYICLRDDGQIREGNIFGGTLRKSERSDAGVHHQDRKIPVDTFKVSPDIPPEEQSQPAEPDGSN